jgi:cytochrome c
MRSADAGICPLARGRQTRILAAWVAAAWLGFAPLAGATEALAREKGCMGCHAVDKAVVGPSFKDVATRYAKTPGAVGMVSRHIREGIQGAWGDMRMPAQGHLQATEAEFLAKWLLGR